MRTTEFAAAQNEPVAKPGSTTAQTNASYQQPVWAVSRMGCISGEHFTPPPDGTVQCPAGFPLYSQERRLERDGSVRVIYAARIGHCRSCPRREECQGYGAATKKPRRVSAVLWPLDTTEKVELAETAPPAQPPPPRLLSRAERAHYRLSWAERLARNARRSAAPDVSIKLFGIPETLATSLGLHIA